MREYFREDEIKSLWREILTDKSVEISRLNDPDSRDRAILIKYEDIDALNRDFALSFIKSPDEYVRLLKESLYSDFLSEGFKSRKDRRVNINISSFLPDLKRVIRDLRSSDLNTFLQIDGIVKRVSEVVPTITMAAFLCAYCKTIDIYPQLGSKLLEPVACSQCGRGKDQTKFQFLPEKSIYMDTQIIEVQEKPELLKGASQPAKLSVHLEDEICGKFNPGDRITVNGILKGKQKFVGNSPTNQFDIFLEATYIGRESSEYEEVQIGDKDVEEIKRVAKDPEIYSKLVSSVAPTIFAMETVKEAVIFQLFGGVRKVFEDGTYVRGDIHILLFGDPGCLIGDERVVLGNGAIWKIGNIGRTHMEKINLPLQTGQGWKRDIATVFHSYRRQPVLEIVTESGKSIVGTYNHPLLVSEAGKRSVPIAARNPITGKEFSFDKKPVHRWKRLDEIRPGDKLVATSGIRCTIKKHIPTSFAHIQSRFGPRSKTILPDRVTPELGAFLGYMLGEGWIGKYKTGFVVAESEKELIDQLSILAKRLFNVAPRILERIPSDSLIGERTIKRKTRLYYCEINSEDVSYNLSFLRNKRAPDLILQSGNAVVSEFIKWLFTADGCVFDKGRGKREVQLKSSDLELLRDVQILLLRFGIHSRIPGVLQQRSAYNLVIRRSKDIVKFREKIGFALKAKQDKLKDLADSVKLKPHKRHSQRTEKVIAVRKLEYADVFDIEVPKGHRFLANGIVSHNTAKSQILKYSINLSPKSIYSSGKGSSAAGLTAAAVKDEFSEGRWTLEAGTLVLADGGLAAVDELDKMSKEDSSALHESMEQQTITISKAGINATLMSRCAVLGAANPKFGRFDENEPFTNQTDFPPTLLSRFDLIFVIVDRPGKTDVDMSNYILKVHSDGEKIASGLAIEKSEFKPFFDHEFMKKYIVYARKFCFPILSPSAKDKIGKFYVEKRASSSKQGSVAITPRQLEALIRLSEASARIRLSDRITEEDVEKGQKLMESFLNQTTLVNGIPDIDIILTGYASKDRKGLLSLSEIIRKLHDENKGRDVSIKQIEEEAKGAGLDQSQVERNIKLLRDKGQLIEPKSGFYRLLRS